MKRTFHVLVALAMFGVVVFYGQPGAAASEVSAATPLKVVVVSGSNYEMGVQYGEQAAALIDGNRLAVNSVLATQVVDANGNPLDPGYPDSGVIAKDIQVWTYYLEKYDPGLKEWLLGISQGCKNKGYTVSYGDLVSIMVFLQEAWARPALPYPVETGVTASAAGKNPTVLAAARAGGHPTTLCSSFAATGGATRGGKPMVSITVGALLAVKNAIILVAFPTDGEPFVSLTLAGRVSSNAGMNNKYAWIMTAAVTDPLSCPSSWGVTSEVYFHHLLQYSKSPAEAVNFLNNTPRGGVTGIFLFADPSGKVFVYETGSCATARRDPGKLGEKDFVATTNDYNDPGMVGYNLNPAYFPDTYVRYATVFEKLKTQTNKSVIDLDFTKGLWSANDWYDATTGTWYTVPVPSDANDPNTCNVPGNLCEGGEDQIIQFPADKIAYLEFGNPQGTSIVNYWPDNPKPTGEYTKWQLRDSVGGVAEAAANDARKMIETAWESFGHKALSLNRETQESLMSLLLQANEAWLKGKGEEESARFSGRQMDLWGAAYTDYATAQLYAQMVTTKLNQH